MSWTPIRLVVKFLPAELTQQELLEKVKPYDVYLQSMDFYPAKIDPRIYNYSQCFLYFQRQDVAFQFIEAAREKKILQFTNLQTNSSNNKQIVIKKAFIQEICQGWKQNYLDNTYQDSTFYKDFQALLKNDKIKKENTVNLDRKPGEAQTVDESNSKKFEIVKTNIILDLEERAQRQKLKSEMNKEKQNKRIKIKNAKIGKETIEDKIQQNINILKWVTIIHIKFFAISQQLKGFLNE